MAIASLVLPPAARSFLQELDHRGGRNNPGGLVLFQGEKLFWPEMIAIAPSGSTLLTLSVLRFHKALD